MLRTRVLSEVDRVADRAPVINGGRIIADGPMVSAVGETA